MIQGTLKFLKENVWKLILFSLGIILIPIFMGLILNIPLGRFTIGTEDSWVSFHGGYIGGITGGIVAYFIAKLQIDEMRAEQKKVHNDNYRKAYLKIENYLDKTEPLLNGQGSVASTMQMHVDSEYNASVEKNDYLKRSYLDSTNETLLELKVMAQEIKKFQNVLIEIPSEYIPTKVFKDFINLEWNLDKIHESIMEFLDKDYIYLTPHSYNPDNFDDNLNANYKYNQYKILKGMVGLYKEYYNIQKSIKEYYLVEEKLVSLHTDE